MRYSVDTEYIFPGRTPEEGIRLIAEAGFDAVDFSFTWDPYVLETGHGESWYRQLRKVAEANGVSFNQAHAPFASSYLDPEKTAVRFREIVRAMRHAGILGVDTVIVHPMRHLRYADAGIPEQLFEMNMEFYGKLIPYCQEYGVRIALENMWQYEPKGVINHSTCSTPAEMIRYHDTLNSPWVTCCLDLGHAALVEDVPGFIRALGPERLQALHVHDVDGVHDNHMPPFTGVGKWDQVGEALKEIGYRGVFTFETSYWFKKLPLDLHGDALKLLNKIGRRIMA